jgi:mannan polymerase II complex MNN11 subunit
MICALGIGAIIFIISQIMSGAEGIPSGTPPVVIVTVVEPGRFGKEYVDNIKENRIEYAKKHGMCLVAVW